MGCEGEVFEGMPKRRDGDVVVRGMGGGKGYGGEEGRGEAED